ncbi:putative FAD-linked oxidoreductase [Lasiodiplodia hormozganensis]|uniref:FAD-linked oxidoreductase n=1 Tax=Lasiodiplodia hormozganensis TaxID=869390 RepID=A0AA39XYI6_9PEZI|nr:putative FAD-linked oxidoreductase [Lasiodiplodia hormozganensis]
MISSGISIGLSLSASALLARAAPIQQCCTLLAQQYPEDVFARNSSTWTTQNTDFWSATEIRNPSCVFLPDSTEKVAGAVALFAQNECKFSIKGGGHSAIPQAANIDDGILMPMERIDVKEPHVEEHYIRVGAGAKLGTVYETLDPLKQCAIIGRYEKVGLGLAVGAGISYWSNKEGLAVDNVINYEVVLANGTIVNANATSHPDLFWALKGGNNNFGVVTHYDLHTVDTEGAMYGGIMYYPESSLDQVADVIYDYHVHQAVDDVYTHTLPQYGFNGTTNETISFTPVVYNKAVDELPEIMKPWIEVNYTKSTLKKRQYTDLAVELNDGFADGLVQEQRVFTVYADAQLYKDLWWNYRVWLQQFRDVDGFYGLHVNMPITPRQVQEGVAKGTNALGLDAQAGNTTLGVIYFGVTFNNLEDAERVLTAHDEFVKSQQELAASRGLLHPYIMLTYSGWNQEAIASYGEENVAKLKEVAAIYDPTQVFQRLVPGGQKLPA